MSLLPLCRFFDMVDTPLENAFGIRPHSNHFGAGLHPPVNHHPSCSPVRQAPFSVYNRPWLTKQRQDNKESTLATTTITKDGFQVCLDVEHFAPNEIIVKTVDNTIMVEGKHEEKEDEHGHIYRHFVRRYTLPKEFDMKDVITTLSSDGILTIKAPTPNKAVKSNERIVQIQQTGPAHLSIKPNPKDDAKTEEKMTE